MNLAARQLIVNLCLSLQLAEVLGVIPNFSTNILPKIATLNKILNFLLQLDVVLDVMAIVLVKLVILAFVMRG